MRTTPYVGPVCFCVAYDPEDDHPCCQERPNLSAWRGRRTSPTPILRYRAEFARRGSGFMRTSIESAIDDAIRGVDRDGGSASILEVRFPDPISDTADKGRWVATILPAWEATDAA